MTDQIRLEVTGVVQGVGFRPFVHRLATELGLDGVVGNDAAQVFIEARGSETRLAALERRLRRDAPPLAAVDSVRRGAATLSVEAGQGFGIAASATGNDSGARTFVSPDMAVCADCLREMRDPVDRRFGHPFITCTNCGPRFTITRSLPYDRASTTMAPFDMCSACRAEYEDPADRRFHAQPIGCHDCGPKLQMLRSDGSAFASFAGDGDPIRLARVRLAAGDIVAIKGLGGFHLAVDARRAAAVAELRERKCRPDKPFAVMVADLEAARELAELSGAEAQLLSSPARPIVLCRSVDSSPLAAAVAPGNPLIGIMLPYTPVHHLLFASHSLVRDKPLGPLVMTSGNVGGEPICHRDDEVVERLGPLADAILTHDRAIHVPCDDSVVRVTDRGLLPIRRSRGYAPLPVRLAGGHQAGPSERSILAVGGELKNAFCITNGSHAWMSQHIGDMENLPTLEAFTRSVDQFRQLYDLHPEVVVADAHPGYRSTAWARANDGERFVEAQHHHAHVVAAMAEHGLDPSVPVLGVAFDGTGDGMDGTIWGGELLVATAEEADRIAHLRHTPLPGGDGAIRHPWRVALSHLRTAGIEWSSDIHAVAAASQIDRALLARQLERDVGCVPTSSMGRFFDALASLVGLRHEISYEAQAAIEFEIAAASWNGQTPVFRFALDDPSPLLRGVCEAIRAGTAVGAIALACHRAIAVGVGDQVTAACRSRGLTTVVLTGGVFQNVLLTDLLARQLAREGLDVRTHRLVPPNDGGLALGQAVIARQRSIAEAGGHRSASLRAESVATPAEQVGA